ncbi:tetratricopeptide repeat protein [Acididesulfobacillus acetoxydans]|uniref:tetratricopeptide repeat protein n=1 Tax=Acididesulfobacillus acetoxydans TaxID=1561005 RepID=UPI001F0F4575|nr:tetratricopeptide repeat protein [Acididesulfobacillus acetoxydans]
MLFASFKGIGGIAAAVGIILLLSSVGYYLSARLRGKRPRKRLFLFSAGIVGLFLAGVPSAFSIVPALTTPPAAAVTGPGPGTNPAPAPAGGKVTAAAAAKPGQEGKPAVSTAAAAPAAPEMDQRQREALDFYNRGLKLYYARRYDQALVLFDRALNLNPASYQALNGKGATYAFLGRYDEGIALIRQALALKPSFEYAQFNLGLANELAGRWSSAISAYQAAIQLNSKDTWAYFGIASIYGRQDNVPKVIEYLLPAIALNPDAKAVAREEQDFAPVRGDPRFQALVKP